MEDKKLSIKDAVLLNTALKECKFDSSDEQSTIAFLNLKIALTDIAEEASAHTTKIQKEVMAQYDIKEGDQITGLNAYKFSSTLNEMIDEYNAKETDINPHILSQSDILKYILSMADNKSANTEHKATILKFLRKE